MNRESEELYIRGKISERDLKDLHDNLTYFKVCKQASNPLDQS